MEVGISLSMVIRTKHLSDRNTMSVTITSVAKQLPQYTRTTKEILPYLKLWLGSQEERFQRKVLKIFENAGVERRYSIMDAQDVFLKTSLKLLLFIPCKNIL